MSIKIAFLYNVRHRYPDPNHPRTQLEADFDDPETIRWMKRHLQKAGFKIFPIEANEKAYKKLDEIKNKIDIAFNYSEGIFGEDREAHIPAILEMLQIPYTGSGVLAQALVLNKARTKEVLKVNGIPTLPFWLIEDIEAIKEMRFRFPVIVKPNSQGSSAGISTKSIVNSRPALKAQVESLLHTFKQPVLVERFAPGREFSVAMLGNPPKILPIVESDHSTLPRKYKGIDSLEVKWYFEEESSNDHLICPAKINGTLLKQIKDICYKTWKALDIKDYCRIDIRCDKKGNPYILEVNSPPGLIPPEVSTTSYFPLAASKLGMSYDDLLSSIITTALKRHR